MVECMLLPLCRCVMPNDHLAASTFEDLFCATIWQQLFYRRQQHGYRNVCDRCTTQQIGSQNIWYPLPETNIQPQKCRGWKIDFLLRWPVFRGYVSFRECIRCIFSRISECFSTRNLERGMLRRFCHDVSVYVLGCPTSQHYTKHHHFVF